MTNKAIIFTTLILILAGVGEGLALNVPLSIKERYGVDRIKEPVTSGIPLAKESNITSVNKLGIFDAAGNQIPAQFRVLSRYDGTPEDSTKPIRVVLVDFQADVMANQEAIYYLKDTGTGTTSGGQLASEDAYCIIINTGPLLAKISKASFSLFDEVILNGQTLVSGSPKDGIFVKYEGKIYSSRNTPVEATIEENGPLRSVIKIKGYFKDSEGNKLFPPLGDNGISYTVRIKAYKDKSYLKVEFRLENENQGWTYTSTDPVHNIDIDSCYLTTTLTGISKDKIVSFAGFTEAFTTGTYQLLQREISDGSEPSYSWLYEIKKNGAIALSGERYDSFADLRDSTWGLMVADRWFWQNHPNGILFQDNQVRFTPWPDVGYKHRILGGIWKTHELIYYFHGADNNFLDELATIKKRLFAKCSDTYYAETNFFPWLVPATITTNFTFSAGEKLQTALELHNAEHRAKYDSKYITNEWYQQTLFTLREERRVKLTDTKYASWYGWLEFGDIPRASNFGYCAQHYDWSYLSLMGFLRFGDYRMLDIGEELVNHKADIIVIHDPLAVPGDGLDWDYHGGQRYEEDALFSYHYDYGPFNSAPRKASHFWTKGLTLQYLLTGEERFREAVTQCYEHIRRVKDDPSMTNNETRNQSRGIDALVNGYLLTGNRTYLMDAYHIFSTHLLDKEGGTGDGKSGWIQSLSSPEVWMCYEAIMEEPLVKLYEALLNAGENDKAANLLAFLLRWGNWVKNSIYTLLPCGSYRNNNTEYFPYIVMQGWDATTGQFTGHTDGQYSLAYADLFALLYHETGNESWLNLARSVFKDYHFYGDTATWTAVKYSDVVKGFFNGDIQSGTFKVAKAITKPMYYIRTEWLKSRKPSLKILKIKLK